MNLFETFMSALRHRTANQSSPAMRAGDGSLAAGEPTKHESAVDDRQTQIAEPDGELTGEAIRLMLQLENRVCLQNLVEQFPRVLNRVAALWPMPRLAEPYLAELIHSGRDNRAGFPLSVLSEINLLRDYYTTKVHPRRTDPWDAALYR